LIFNLKATFFYCLTKHCHLGKQLSFFTGYDILHVDRVLILRFVFFLSIAKMATPQAMNHALLRPSILQIFRAAGFQGARSTVIDAATEATAKFMHVIMQCAAMHAQLNGNEYEITIPDVRMAMQDCGMLLPEKVLEEQEFDGVEDTRGVEAFIAWAKGTENREIRRIALEGPDGAKEDYLTGLFTPEETKTMLTLRSSEKETQHDR
jgi:hypothetical protein